MSSLEFFDGILTSFGYLPFGSAIAEGARRVHGKLRNTEFNYIETRNLTENDKLFRSPEFATALDILSKATKSKTISTFSGFIGQMITSGTLVENWVNEDQIDDLVYDLFSRDLMSAESELAITQKYVIASSYLQSLIDNKSLSFSYKRNKLNHNLSSTDIVNMNQDLINIFIELNIK